MCVTHKTTPNQVSLLHVTEIQFFNPQRTVNQITASNAVFLLTSSLFLSLRNPQKYIQLQL